MYAETVGCSKRRVNEITQANSDLTAKRANNSSARRSSESRQSSRRQAGWFGSQATNSAWQCWQTTF